MSELKRIFVVGCFRSGTTLIQRCLANHPSACSFPETGFFRQLCGNKIWTKITKIGLVRRNRVYRAFNRLSRVMPELRYYPKYYSPILKTNVVVDSFVRILDNFTSVNNKKVWIEKTPQHYRSAEVINKFVKNSCIIHVVRDGRDVLGSIRNRAIKYPENFGRQYNPDHGIKEWNWSINNALSQARLPNVYILRLESFTQNPRDKIEKICQKLNIPFDFNMLNPGSKWMLKETREPWKSGIDEHIRMPESKFDELFKKNECQYIINNLNLSLLNEIDKYSI